MSQIRVLLVDDNETFRDTVRRFLARQEGVEVVGEAGEAKAGLVLAQELKPDVVLMDLVLPGVNGFEAARWLTEKFPDIRVVALTMHDTEAHRQAAAESGCSAFVSKLMLWSELMPALTGAEA